jgi:phage shock protein B
VCIFGLPILAICGFIFLRALRILKGDPNQRSREAAMEEIRLMQELHDGLQRMEKRVEALETIILDQSRKEP